MKRLIIGLALVAAGLLILAACAGEEEEKATPTPRATNTLIVVEMPTQPPTSTLTVDQQATKTAVAAKTATAKAAATPVAATATKPAATPAAATATKAAAGDATKGKTVWDANCNTCHPGGAKGAGPAVTGTKLTDAELATIIVSGKGSMLGYTKLTVDDIANLIAYIRTLK